LRRRERLRRFLRFLLTLPPFSSGATAERTREVKLRAARLRFRLRLDALLWRRRGFTTLTVGMWYAPSKSVKLIDLCSGEWGWSAAFAAKGWECFGYDLVEPRQTPARCHLILRNILSLTPGDLRGFDFGVASTPCEQFACWGMRHFHPDPPHPELGIKLFNHARRLFEESGIPYVMENVRAAQQFVGTARHRCGPFYLWGNAVPPLMPQGISKGQRFRGAPGAYMMRRPQHVSVKEWRNCYQREAERLAGGRRYAARHAAVIPSILAKCAADYAEVICSNHNQNFFTFHRPP
jgi:hypothetical protein